MAKKFVFFKISKFVHFQIFILSNTNRFYYCFLLDCTCTLVPAIELVSIWHTLDRISISISILHLSLENRKNRKASTIKTFKNLKYLLLCKNGCHEK